MKAFCIRILFMYLLLLPGAQAAAATLAVFPLLDLTQDANGVNFILTDAVRQKAAEYGFDVVPDTEVMSFMVRHRIRRLGTLSSYEILNLKKELAVEYVLLGTVCQLAPKPTAKVSISLQMIRTIDEEIVWSIIKDLHQYDLISLLGLSAPESLNDLYVEYFDTLLDTVSTDGVGTVDDHDAIGLLSVQMHPLYVKPSERIELAARIYSTTNKEAIQKISLLINDRVYPVELDDETYYFKSSWQAEESPGEYSVDMVAEFHSGRKQVMNLGEYTVDSVSPEVKMNLLGTVIDDVVYFNKDLVITLRMTVPEQLSRWELSVIDEDDENVLTFSGTGKLPGRVYWNGMLSGTKEAADGRYIVKVTVWDRADNSSFDEKKAVLRKMRPEFNITVVRNEHGATLSLDTNVQYPISYWWVKVYEKKGGLVTTKVGEKFPSTIDIEYDFDKSSDTLELFIAAQDVYGNRGGLRIPDMLKLGEEQAEVEYVQEKDWLESF